MTWLQSAAVGLSRKYKIPKTLFYQLNYHTTIIRQHKKPEIFHISLNMTLRTVSKLFNYIGEFLVYTVHISSANSAY